MKTIAILSNGTEIEVDIDPKFAEYYGTVQAVIEAAQATETYKAARAAEDAQIEVVVIDGEEITQF